MSFILLFPVSMSWIFYSWRQWVKYSIFMRQWVKYFISRRQWVKYCTPRRDEKQLKHEMDKSPGYRPPMWWSHWTITDCCDTLLITCCTDLHSMQRWQLVADALPISPSSIPRCLAHRIKVKKSPKATWTNTTRTAKSTALKRSTSRKRHKLRYGRIVVVMLANIFMLSLFWPFLYSLM